jgi:hypothetical protein
MVFDKKGRGSGCYLVTGIGMTVAIVYLLVAGGGCGQGRFVYPVNAGLRQTDLVVLDGGEQMRVTDDHVSQHPSFNPDGSEIVFSSGRDGEFDPELGSSGWLSSRSITQAVTRSA